MASVRLLVIDDSATIRAVIEQIVESDPDCGALGLADSVASARHLIADMRPNVITLDLAMPGVSGMEFLDELSGHRHAPIVVLSSSSQSGSATAATALARGAYACFDKNKVVLEADRFRRLLKKAVRHHERELTKAQPAV